MAKDKERTLNPAAAQRKLEKQKALKKGKAQLNAQRTERFASRNPHRLENQIKELQAQKESQGGKLNTRDQKHLEELERDVERIKKARQTLGDRAPLANRQDRREGGDNQTRPDRRDRHNDRDNANHTALGKRKFRSFAGADDDWAGSESEEPETDEDVRRIPWPRDTPPPIPQRSGRHGLHDGGKEEDIKPDTSLPSRPPAARAAPIAAPKTTYESAPQLRDLRKEATAATFLPAAVKKKLDAAKGKGKLLEEEELARLERQGYISSQGAGEQPQQPPSERGGGVARPLDEETQRLRQEEEAFAREIAAGHGNAQTDARNHATVEEASDEDIT